MDTNEFRTLKGYQLIQSSALTSANEDYLEMICRLYKNNTVVRVNILAIKLNVNQSSVTKMLHHLKALELVEYHKYGYVVPTEKGIEIGEYFIERHNILNQLLCLINNSENELEQVEKIEHFLDKRTVYNIKDFIVKIKNFS